MHRLPRRSGVAALALATLVALGACGAEDGESSRGGENGSSGSTPGEGSTTSPEPAAGGDGSPAEPDAKGAVSYQDVLAAVKKSVEQGRTATFVMTSRSGEVRTVQRGEVDYRQDPVAMRVTLEPGAGLPPTETLLVGGNLYTKMGAGESATYMKMPLPEGTASPLDTTQMDLDQALSAMAKGVESTERLAAKKFDGETLNGYRSVIRSKDVLGSSPGAAAIPATYVYDLWFDGSGAVRRAVVDMGKLGTTEMVYSDWGRDVTIKEPPASQVQEMPSAHSVDELPTP